MDAKELILKKVGPLPVVAWVGIGSAGVFVWRLKHPAKPKVTPGISPAVGPDGSPMTDLAGTFANNLDLLNSRLDAETQAINNSNPNNIPTGTSLDNWLMSLYRQYVGRPYDPEGLVYWRNYAATYGRTATEAALAKSPEALTHQINELYKVLLGREPDQSGQAYWLSYAQTYGLNATQLAMMNTEEYQKRVNSGQDTSQTPGGPVPQRV
jgi:hypothetical protein